MSDKKEELTQIIEIIDNNIQSILSIYDKPDCLAKGHLHGLYKARHIVSQFVTINDTHRLLNKKYPVDMYKLSKYRNKEDDNISKLCDTTFEFGCVTVLLVLLGIFVGVTI